MTNMGEILKAGVAGSQRTSFEDLGGKRLDPAANLAVRMAMSNHLKEVAAADQKEGLMNVDYDLIRQLADGDETNPISGEE